MLEKLLGFAFLVWWTSLAYRVLFVWPKEKSLRYRMQTAVCKIERRHISARELPEGVYRGVCRGHDAWVDIGGDEYHLVLVLPADDRDTTPCTATIANGILTVETER